ncbi:MAG: orotate phosphoribosyltransferase [Xanthomonadaceae bacterium]|nr:orotate phosphoribosyltransferase [Xanthomonadaceae bacterium]
MDSKTQLASLIKRLSYKEGDFTLASGKKSNFYVDLKNTTLHPEGADLLGTLIVRDILEKRIHVDGVGGMTMGADPIATAVSLAAFSRGLVWPAFIVRKDPKDHGTGQYVEGTANLSKGSRLLVVEDVVTTGGSSLKAIERLKAEGYTIAALMTIVDREQGGRDAFESQGVQFLNLLTLNDVKSAK